MLAYYVLYVLVGIGYLCTHQIANRDRRKRIYCIYLVVLLGLFMGLRSINVGVDLKQYLFRYENTIRLFGTGLGHSEWGYNYLTLFFSEILGFSFRGFLFVISVFIAYGTITCIKKYSESILISLIVYLSLGLFTLELSGLRQAIAVTLTLFAFWQAENRKWLTFSILVAIAYVMHNSAIVYLPVYFLWKIRLTKRLATLIYIVSLLSILYRQLLNPLISILMPDKYSGIDLSAGYQINPLVIIVPIIISLFMLVFLPIEVDRRMNERNSVLYIMSCLYFACLIISMNNNLIGRLSYYYAFGNIIALPTALKRVRRIDYQMGILVAFIVLGCCSLYFFYSTPGGTLQIDNYQFFWLE